MKLVRVFLIALAVVAVLVLAAGGLVFTSSFQTWAVRRALADRPDLNVTLDRVSAGFNRLRAENVRVVRSGAVLTLPAVEIDLPVYAAAMQEKFLVRRLVAHGWTLDLTHAQMPVPAPIPPRSAPRVAAFSLLPSADAADATPLAPIVFGGIFNQLKLPVDLSLAGVDLAGEVLLPAVPGRPAARARVTLLGGDLAANHPGKFDYTAVIQFEGDGAAVTELKVRGTLGVVMDTPRTFSRLVAATVAEATGPNFPDGVKLSVDLSAERTAVGESYAVAVLAGTKQLALAEASYAAGESHLRGAWRLDMRSADLAPFVLGRELPLFEATGDGKFDVDTTFTELIASGRLNATAGRLGAIWPELQMLGAVKLVADFDLSQRDNATRVDRLALTITGAKPIATLEALQAFEFNLKTGELNVADPAKELLGVVFQGLPVTWVSRLISRTGFVLSGDELQGELAASARDGGFTLRPKAPLTIGNLSVATKDGRPLLQGVDVSVAASADYTPQGWQVEFAPLSVTSAAGPLFALEVRAGQLAGKDQPVKVAGKWTAHLPALLAQPMAAGAVDLTSGEVQGDFAASLGAKREVQVRLTLTRLESPAVGSLPNLTADFRADLGADGLITFNAPLFFDQAGRRSDLTLAGTLMPGATSSVLATRLTSSQLVIDDVKNFALPFLAPLEAPAKPAKSVSASPHDGTAFWSELKGTAHFTFKNVVCTNQVQVTDVSGLLRVEPEAIKLEDGNAAFGPDSTVRVSGSVTHDENRAKPYVLTADFALNNFDVAPALRALNPTKPPTVEGRVNVVSHLTGAGTTLEEMADRTRGDLKLTGKSGIFRALATDLPDQIQKSQTTITAIGSFLGVVTDDYVNKAKITADIIRALTEIPYDQLSLTATRDEALNLQIKDFSLISPEVRLGGTGTLLYAEGVPLVSQALDLQLTLGVRGHLADLMKRAGLLEKQQDGLGYAAFSVPLTVGGTPAKPDTSAIRRALLNSALERSGLLDSVFGGKGSK
ncbi:MAG: hypothetical protein ABI222_04310 [Opitutaceae bacterium]